MSGDNKDGHDGDTGVAGEEWQEMNCYLEETASGFSPSIQAPLLFPDSIPRLDSKCPIMHLRFWQIPQIFNVLSGTA